MYECKKCGKGFEDLNEFKGHNLRCKVEEKSQRNNKRKERIPLGVPRRKLSWDDQDEGYVYRVVHNRPGRPNRVNDALNAGYEFVVDKNHMGDSDASNEMGSSVDSRVTSVVGEDDKGSPMTGYLMRIKKEWYEEDQKKKQQKIDETEEQIFKGVDSQGRPGAGGRYVPADPSGRPLSQIER